MQDDEMQPAGEELRAIVVQAAQLLARLDVNKLEELALSCEALSNVPSPGVQQALASEARATRRDMDVLAKVLEATRNNAAVMNRLRRMHESRKEYGGDAGSQMKVPEAAHGHD
jgi:hypothetical protein